MLTPRSSHYFIPHRRSPACARVHSSPSSSHARHWSAMRTHVALAIAAVPPHGVCCSCAGAQHYEGVHDALGAAVSCRQQRQPGRASELHHSTAWALRLRCVTTHVRWGCRGHVPHFIDVLVEPPRKMSPNQKRRCTHPHRDCTLRHQKAGSIPAGQGPNILLGDVALQAKQPFCG